MEEKLLLAMDVMVRLCQENRGVEGGGIRARTEEGGSRERVRWSDGEGEGMGHEKEGLAAHHSYRLCRLQLLSGMEGRKEGRKEVAEEERK